MSTKTRFEKEAKGNSEMVYSYDSHFKDDLAIKMTSSKVVNVIHQEKQSSLTWTIT